MDEERESAEEEEEEEGSEAVYESDGRESISASSFDTEAGVSSAGRELVLESSGSDVCGTVAESGSWEGLASGSAEEGVAGLRWVLGSMFQGSCGNRAPGVPLRG